MLGRRREQFPRICMIVWPTLARQKPQLAPLSGPARGPFVPGPLKGIVKWLAPPLNVPQYRRITMRGVCVCVCVFMRSHTHADLLQRTSRSWLSKRINPVFSSLMLSYLTQHNILVGRDPTIWLKTTTAKDGSPKGNKLLFLCSTETSYFDYSPTKSPVVSIFPVVACHRSKTYNTTDYR